MLSRARTVPPRRPGKLAPHEIARTASPQACGRITARLRCSQISPDPLNMEPERYSGAGCRGQPDRSRDRRGWPNQTQGLYRTGLAGATVVAVLRPPRKEYTMATTAQRCRRVLWVIALITAVLLSSGVAPAAAQSTEPPTNGEIPPPPPIAELPPPPVGELPPPPLEDEPPSNQPEPEGSPVDQPGAEAGVSPTSGPGASDSRGSGSADQNRWAERRGARKATHVQCAVPRFRHGRSAQARPHHCAILVPLSELRRGSIVQAPGSRGEGNATDQAQDVRRTVQGRNSDRSPHGSCTREADPVCRSDDSSLGCRRYDHLW